MVLLSILCLWLFPCHTFFAQDTSLPTAPDHIQALRNGHLTIVIPYELNKLNELKKIMESESLSERQKRRARRIYEETIQERRTLESEVRTAIEQEFDFTDTRLIYDFELRSKLPGDLALAPDPLDPPPGEGKEYQLRFGKTQSAQNFGVEAAVITDAEGNQLPGPFPYYVKLNKKTWLYGIFSIISTDFYNRKDGSEILQEFDEKLTEYYLEVTGKKSP